MAREEKGTPMGSINSGGSGSGSGSDAGSSLAARRARLRGSLSRAGNYSDEANAVDEPVEQQEEAEVGASGKGASKSKYLGSYAQALGGNPPVQDPSGAQAPSQPQPPVSITPVVAASQAIQQGASQQQHSASPTATPAPSQSQSQAPSQSQIQAASQSDTTGQSPLAALSPIPDAAIEILGSIDGALSACATNLAALQRLSAEQTDVLKSLSSTLQNQTLFEIGLNLNSLTESLSAALEPMRAFGELVPAMDQLVSSLEGRPAQVAAAQMTPDDLVAGLADQLCSGLIDSWTFKCAYMAIYPSEHPADLLHRLVELLGQQRLSGDLFRAAYEAVQGADGPSPMAARAGATADSGGGNQAGAAAGVEIRNKIEELEKANIELRGRQEQRELELQSLLQQKEKELSDAQGLLNNRYDQFNARYEEVAEALGKQGDEYRTLLESKDMELVEKESELSLLRAQMEELRNQTEDMVKDLQKQLIDMKSVKPEPAKQAAGAGGGFFDSAPQQAARPTYEAPRQGYDTSSSSLPPHPAAQMTGAVSTSQPVQAIAQPQPQQQAPQVNVQPSPLAVSPPPPGGQSPQPRPAAPAQPAPTTPFQPGAGSYGSGVRAQVFEVIVRQALAGAPWREICSGPMQVNNISPEEVESEVKRRQALLNK